MCLNCISLTHSASECKSKHRCKTCNQLHHSWLHTDSRGGNKSAGSIPQSDSPTLAAIAEIDRELPRCQVQLAPTATVIASGASTSKKARVLMDPGCKRMLITKRCTQQLGATKLLNTAIDIQGIDTTVSSPYSVQFQLTGTQSSTVLDISAQVVDSIPTCLRPSDQCEVWTDPLIQGLVLADGPGQTMSELDIMLSATNTIRCSFDTVLSSKEHTLAAKQTIFRWTLDDTHTGLKPYHGKPTGNACLKAEPVPAPPTANLRVIWAMEQFCGEGSMLKADDQQALDHFEATHT